VNDSPSNAEQRLVAFIADDIATRWIKPDSWLCVSNLSDHRNPGTGRRHHEL